MPEHSSSSNEYELCFRTEQLRSLRKLRKISQEKLAKEIGTDQASVSLIERAATKIDFDRLVGIAKALSARIVFDLEPSESASLQPSDTPVANVVQEPEKKEPERKKIDPKKTRSKS